MLASFNVNVNKLLISDDQQCPREKKLLIDIFLAAKNKSKRFELIKTYP